MPEAGTPGGDKHLVLITRPREDATRTAQLVERRGYTPLIAPFLHISCLKPALPRSVQALLLTSGNALGALTPWPVKVLTVGDATATRARAAGFTHVESAGRDATALIALATARLDPAQGPVLLACGAGQGYKVATALRDAGFRVVRRVTYRAAPIAKFPPAVAAALRGNQVHAAIFMSAETAAAFVRRCPKSLHPTLQNVLALAIGKPAADALETLRWREVRLAPAPTLDDVLALL